MTSEFDFIRNIKQKFGLNQVGDDCAVIPKDDRSDLVVTTDMLIEGVDFRLDWTTPEFLGHKALAVSLSDVAAMGARPDWAMLSIGVPPGLWGDHFLDMFYTGWHELAAEHGVELIGGDVSRSPVPVGDRFDRRRLRAERFGRSAIFGKARRSIYVSGSLGGAAGGLALFEQGRRLTDAVDQKALNLLRRQLQPQPRNELGITLGRDHLASSMIDISDGFSSDLYHLCEQSGVGALIDNVPVDDDLSGYFDPDECLRMALHGGEDLELLFTVNPENSLKANELPVLQVGVVTPNAGKMELATGSNRSVLSSGRLSPFLNSQQ